MIVVCFPALLTTTTMTDDRGSRTMTPDQINVEALLATRDYYNNTQSDITGEFGQSGRLTGEFGPSGHLAQTLERSDEFQTGDMEKSGNYGNYTMGSTSDISLPPGLTQTMERSASGDLSQERLTYSGELEENGLRVGTAESVRYPDSLDGTGEMDKSGRREEEDGEFDQSEERFEGKRTGPLQVSVTIPSMGEEDDSGDSVDDMSSMH